MGYIGTAPLSGDYRKLDDISSGFDGVETTFVLQVGSVTVTPPKATAVIISVGGVLQEPISAYDISVSSIIFTAPPAAGADFFGVMLGIGVAIGTPGDDTVTTGKIADNAVTLAKMAGGTAGNLTSFDASGDPVAVATGTAGQLLTSAGVDAPPTFVDAAVSSQTHNFVADGAITAGAPVSLQANGTVAALEEPTNGLPVTFTSSTVTYQQMVYDTTNNRIVIVYKDDSNSFYTTAVVGTIAGGAITFGTPVVVNSYNSYDYDQPSQFAYNSGVFALYYSRNAASSYSRNVRILTVSGAALDTISVGAEATVVTTTYYSYPKITFAGAGRLVVGIKTGSASAPMYTYVGTISGTGASATTVWGVGNTYDTNQAYTGNGLSYDTAADKILVSWTGYDNTATIWLYAARVGTISGTGASATMTFGAVTPWPTNRNTSFITYDALTGKHIVSHGATSTVVTITGTTPSFGTLQTTSLTTAHSYNTSLNKYVEAAGLSLRLSTLTGTTWAQGTSVKASLSGLTRVAYDPDSDLTAVLIGNYVLLWDAVNTTSNADDWLGFADAAIADGETGAVRLMGSVVGNQTGLTPHHMYRLEMAATLIDNGTSATSSTREVGLAISATELLITKPRFTG